MFSQYSLYLVCGIPCSGKSSFADYLVKTTGYTKVEFDKTPNLVALLYAGLEKRKIVGPEPSIEDFNLLSIFSIAYLSVENMKKYGGVVVDAPLDNIRGRDVFIRSVRNNTGNTKAFVYWMDTSLYECLKRFESREKDEKHEFLTEEEIRHVHSNALPPFREEPFDKIFFVSSPLQEYYMIREIK